MLGKEIRKLHHEMEELVAHRQRLYEDYVERLIDAEQYEAFADRDVAAETELRKRLGEITQYQKKYDRNNCVGTDGEAVIKKYRNTRHLTKKMVDAFVERIETFSAGKVIVYLVYGTCWKNWNHTQRKGKRRRMESKKTVIYICLSDEDVEGIFK